jgi:hypothetical protein
MSNTAAATLEQPIQDAWPPERVLSIPEAAALANIGYSTLKQEIADGRGPKLTHMTKGRVGITLRNFGLWLDQRTEP